MLGRNCGYGRHVKAKPGFSRQQIEEEIKKVDAFPSGKCSAGLGFQTEPSWKHEEVLSVHQAR